MDQRMISLAGHDRGEQVFMPQIATLLNADAGMIHTLVFKAGGHFYLPENTSHSDNGDRSARNDRGHWYRELDLNPTIEDAVAAELNQREPFLSLHLRYTDRSHQAPNAGSIEKALRTLAMNTGTTSLFIASDTPRARDNWCVRASKLGLDPWVVDHTIWDRSHPHSAHPALIDWRLLSRSRAIVYFAGSSFAHEAAVATGNFDSCIGLTPSHMSLIDAKIRGILKSLVSYPKRHHWLSSKS